MERWRRLAAAFDARASRERVLVLCGAVLGAILAFQAVAIDPLLTRQKRLAQQLAEARQNIRSAETLVKIREGRIDPDAVRRSYRDELRKQLAAIDASMQGLQRRLVPPERMAKLLEEMLEKDAGLRLVSLRTLPVQRFESPGAAPAAAQGGKAPKPASAETERSIYQHSIEVTLQGSYLELHAYLVRLERSPLHMFWGRLGLDAARYPTLTATLIVHTLSLSKAWLVV
jgi:MSHA biogenesis protein MshJ